MGIPMNPENMSTPSRSADSAPRTPERAVMQDAAFADMARNTSLPQTPSTVGPGSLATSDDVDVGIATKFDRLFFMAERYAYSHMNYPSTSKDGNLPLSIKERLMKAATRETAHQLASTGATRFFLMNKVIIQWIIKHIFTPFLFKSFDLDADVRIASFKDNIYQDTPAIVKYQMLSEIGKEIQQIRDHPNFRPFLHTLVTNQCAKLWSIVQPLMHNTTSMDRSDLKTLIYEAYRVAGDMAVSPLEWRFDFADVGLNYHVGMISRDPYIQGREEDLASRGLVVRLGFIPAVYMRDNADGVVKIDQLTRQHVLIKAP